MIQTRYVNAGPMQAQASMGAATAPGEALAQVGGAIANIGEAGLRMAGQAREKKEKVEARTLEITESGKINAFMANADKEASEFSIGLAKRFDTDKWGDDWGKAQAGIQERSKAQGLSAEGQARLDNHLIDWSSKKDIGFRTQAAVTGLGIAKTQSNQTLEFYADQNDLEGYNRTLGENERSGLYNPAEIEKAQRYGVRLSGISDLKAMAQGDPASMAEFPEEEILKRVPGVTSDDVQKYKREAVGLWKDQSREAGERAMDDIADGMTDPEKLKTDPKYSKMRPSVREHAESVMAERAQDGYRERMATPEAQQQRYGEVSEGLASYNSEGGDSDLVLARVDAAMRDIKPGFLKDKLEKQYKEIVENKALPESKSYGEYVLNQVDELHKSGRFGELKTPDKLNTEQMVKDGFLKDEAKHMRLGFDAEQAGKIRVAAEGSPAAGQMMFKTLWKDRKSGSVAASGIEIAVADALHNENVTVAGFNDPDSEAAAKISNGERSKKYGIAKMKMADFLRLNPTASSADVDAAYTKYTGEHVRLQASGGLLATRPTMGEIYNGMVLPDKESAAPNGAKGSIYGYPGDTTPDKNSSNGIGSFTTEADAKGSRNSPTRLRVGDFALSPDMEAKMRASGVNERDTVTVKYSDGSTHTGRWMDRTSDKLTGRVDIYAPDGKHHTDGVKVVSWTR